MFARFSVIIVAVCMYAIHSSAEEAQESADENVFTNSIGMKFVWIPPGEFMMGGDQLPEEVVRLGGGQIEWYRREHPRRKVTISKGFWLGEAQVTQGQWEKVMETTVRQQRDTHNSTSSLRGHHGDDYPMYFVSWHEAVEFCRRLGEKEGRKYRLPTEAEWEYACRAGTTTPFNTGDTINTYQVNYDGLEIYGDGVKGADRKRTMPVKWYPPNAWGLYSMHGNVWEWVADWFGDYPEEDAVDTTGPETGIWRVVRGGAWASPPTQCRSAYRLRQRPTYRQNTIGFRVCVELEAEE